MVQQTQVAIVGGGPVGVALAVQLARFGIASVVVEQRTRLSRIPKGQNLTQRTLEHFHFWGIADGLRSARLMPPGYPIGEFTSYGTLISPYWHAPAGRELVRAFYFQDNERLPQYQLESVLREKLATLKAAQLLVGWSATAIEQDDRGARVTITDANGESDVIEAEYAVGCDGGQSMVRNAVGIARSGHDYDQPMLLAVFRSKELHEALHRYPERSIYRVMHPDLKGYWQFFGRIDVGEGWFFHAPVPPGISRDDIDPHKMIEEAAGFSFTAEYEHIGFWDLRVAIADAYRRGRVFIAGDAAHTHPPYGGFGLNNGLEDAVNLGWKLVARLQGWGGDALLDSYGEERRPVIVETAEEFIAKRIERDAAFLARYNPERDLVEFEAAWATRLDEIGSRFQHYEPHYDGSSVVLGPTGGRSGAQGPHMMKARAGHHLAPVVLSSGRNVFDALGLEFTLLAFGAEERQVAAFEGAAAKLGVPLAVVRDSFEGAREQYEARLVLVRPDQYVAWCGHALEDDAQAIVGPACGRSYTESD